MRTEPTPSHASVVIPCYNLGAHLPEAVESVRRQTLPARELVIVDDGSTDEQTLEVLDRCRAEGIKVIRTPNQGAPAARNRGIRATRSKFVLCLDADDVLLPTFLEETVPVLQATPSAGVVGTHLEFFGDVQGIWQTPEFAPTTMLWRNCLGSASLFRRQCWRQVGGYPDLPACQDWSFWIAVLSRGWEWRIVPKVLYRYRRRAGSISAYREANRAEILRQVHARHREVYEAAWSDVLVQVDGEMQRLQDQLRRFRHDAKVKSERIATLEAELRASPTGAELRRLKDELRSANEERTASADRVRLLEAALRQPAVNGTRQGAGGGPSTARPAAGAETWFAGVPPTRPTAAVPTLDERRAKVTDLEKKLEYARQDVRRLEIAPQVADAAAQVLPVGARVLVVSRGEGALIALHGRKAEHFPQMTGGEYAGRHPTDSAEAIAHLESLRGQGAEYFALPSTSFWWLRTYREFGEHLERRYRAVHRDSHCVIFDVRSPKEHHTFSVVICTYKRAKLLGKAIESVFAQEYPREQFELIVINNDSPDETAQVVAEYQARSPIPFSYHVEKQNGLSYARNLGIATARHEYVAFLDDDAVAGRNWLASFNAVINDHHALVVGGRVEKAFEEGFVPPPWFHYQYLKHFFGVNYRDRGKKEKVFRIRHPLYLSGGNSAYARRLFDHFGGFDTQLGRDGKTLLGAEEAYLNLVLDRHEIPIYYTDDAYIEHYVEAFRVTKSHLGRKAYWSGVSNAIMYPMFFGYRETLAKTRSNFAEMRRLAGAVLRAPRSPENVSRSCRLIYHASFLWKLAKVYARYRVLGPRYVPQNAPSWGPAQWISEITRWPEDREKYEQLYHLSLSLGDEDQARHALERLAPYLAPGNSPEADERLERFWGPVRRLKYQKLVTRIREVAQEATRPGSTVLVVSKGDPELISLDGRTGRHFPQTRDGSYAGHYPATGADAIGEMERLRRRGGDYLLFPATALWWLDHYQEFREHLEQHYRVVTRVEDVCLIFELWPSNSSAAWDRAAVPAASNGAGMPAAARGPRPAGRLSWDT